MTSDGLESYALANGLKPMGVRAPLGQYLREAWIRRDFAWTLAVLGKEAENSRTRLGAWWSLLVPLIQSSIYGLIFGIILGSHRAPNFIPFLVTGVFLFNFVSGSFQTGASSITSNSGLLRSISFPRIALPLSAVFRQVLNLLPTLPIMLVVILIFDHILKWEIVIMPAVIALLFLFGLGIALIAARLTVQVRDLTKLLPFLTRMLFYVSGVFYTPAHLGLGETFFGTIVAINPVYAFMSLARGALVTGYEVHAQDWAIAGVWTAVVLVFGVVYFWRAEERYGDD
ncbi:MAG: hypothetical protein RLZ72_850 [Actinomycetota bacterium]